MATTVMNDNLRQLLRTKLRLRGTRITGLSRRRREKGRLVTASDWLYSSAPDCDGGLMAVNQVAQPTMTQARTALFVEEVAGERHGDELTGWLWNGMDSKINAVLGGEEQRCTRGRQ